MREYRKVVQTGEDSVNFCSRSWFLTFYHPFPKRLYRYDLLLYATLLLTILHYWVFLQGPHGHFTSARSHGSSLPLPASVLFFRLCKWVLRLRL